MCKERGKQQAAVTVRLRNVLLSRRQLIDRPTGLKAKNT